MANKPAAKPDDVIDATSKAVAKRLTALEARMKALENAAGIR